MNQKQTPIEIGGKVYERVYVAELEPGMVNAFGDVVKSVERMTGDDSGLARVVWVEDSAPGATSEPAAYLSASGTMLIEQSTIPEDDTHSNEDILKRVRAASDLILSALEINITKLEQGKGIQQAQKTRAKLEQAVRELGYAKGMLVENLWAED